MKFFGRKVDPDNLATSATRALKWWLIGAATLQVGTVAGILTYDQFRKHRVPGGFKGFPHLPPTPAELADNNLTVYTNGQALYADMLQAIREAKESIYFETFIWKGDNVGKEFKKELIAAAQRGVKVYCIYDTFANLVVNPKFKIFPRNKNFHILRFPLMRPDLILLRMRMFGRTHRKVLVVDSKVGWVGGYNIGDLYATSWRDTQVRVEGPAVWELENAFVEFWNDFRKNDHPPLPDQGAKQWDTCIQAVVNAPNKILFPIRGAYIDAIARASKRIWITQAYFIPDPEFIAALIAAAKRGVDVKVLIPERSNHILADWAAAPHFQTLLAGGVEVWLYKHAMVHAKTATIDGRWATIGTANIDRLSLTGNFEINLSFHGESVAQVMEKVFQKDLTTSRRLDIKQWENRPTHWRVIERIIKPLGFWL
ncbi:cardiolipin synthase B [Boudabousia tangfeifanii]|uniref:Cardiolipin synthase B n=1 Tax=Boudabousia tangfeifanii TaxID=1912795 RepID=A0A1D9MJA2_9ACTO|nr:phospholipase D-like domain-containing protein [Boudabousia tangfeifanii]AOZ72374.1 cardiolipin synthase B [Boudabousia tangfeifanii]